MPRVLPIHESLDVHLGGLKQQNYHWAAAQFSPATEPRGLVVGVIAWHAKGPALASKASKSRLKKSSDGNKVRQDIIIIIGQASG